MASLPESSGDADRDELIVMRTNNSATGAEPLEQRERGRPSVAEERRGQIVDAFIDLIAETGSAEVTVDGAFPFLGKGRFDWTRCGPLLEKERRTETTVCP